MHMMRMQSTFKLSSGINIKVICAQTSAYIDIFNQAYTKAYAEGRANKTTTYNNFDY